MSSVSVTTLASIGSADGKGVSVRDERRFAMLFQSVVLPCHYTSVSSQTPVIQWWYKSYCHDLSRDAFRFPDTLAVHGSELGSSVHLDCGDSGQTVHIVASGQGSSITLAEHYKGRDISILNSDGLCLPTDGSGGAEVCSHCFVQRRQLSVALLCSAVDRSEGGRDRGA
uniref:Si:zfos-1011f11.2 n=1 Tax=Sinocyclocheilus grahami TaxID=75366 RepID=A0A672KM98_SINGR